MGRKPLVFWFLLSCSCVLHMYVAHNNKMPRIEGAFYIVATPVILHDRKEKEQSPA